eukprot:CAMPEP_0184293794 /NCGR_PEP_ID=MMETSP1049-20130417/5131_1 /TAXON_ID=77928 /ORGANISM="Proteomonas sulcata, Strain CCMP704" /LENGTH=337 /DNA_ID=CAMNT_0026601865 /DNA_START=66 /DNA_END=1079 /DNA_ORIENTATION=-
MRVPGPGMRAKIISLGIYGAGGLLLIALLSSIRVPSKMELEGIEAKALRALRASDQLLSNPQAHRASAPHAKVSPKTRDAMIQAAAKEIEAQVLGKKAAGAKAKRQLVNLADTEEAEDSGDSEEAEEKGPPLYEHYKKGMVGIAGVSKWVPADHPEGHKKCPLHDIDCDELWPWGKVNVKGETGPPKRHSILGDNMVGVFGQDDVVVPTEDSGLLPKAQRNVDQFDHWPEDSKKNKDLLYGSARKIISKKYLGIGDEFIPLESIEAHRAQKAKHQPFPDMAFGSWQQGFDKPHDHEIREDVNMFDQPFRQHWAAAKGKGHQVFHVKDVEYGKTLGDD